MSDADFVIPFDRLPERFAESIDNPPAVPSEPRPAATIVLLRDGDDGLELLLMKRNRSAGFVPGAYVFPGGRVDGTDARPDILEWLDGVTTDSAAERLSLHADAPPAIAYYLAALREAFEETGILVALRPDGTAPPTAAEDDAVDDIRNRLMDQDLSFADAIAGLECRIDGNAIEYIGHWITPEPEPRRYDTRFFAAKVRSGATPIVDPREMTDAIWIGPAAALERYERGSLAMVFPTIKTIEQLRGYATVDETLAGFAGMNVRTIMPTLVITPTGVGLEIDDDDNGGEPDLDDGRGGDPQDDDDA